MEVPKEEVTDEDATKKVKPALKKHSVLGADPATESERPKKEIKWDEEVIEEHDQLRGTRMKVSVCTCIG